MTGETVSGTHRALRVCREADALLARGRTREAGALYRLAGDDVGERIEEEEAALLASRERVVAAIGTRLDARQRLRDLRARARTWLVRSALAAVALLVVRGLLTAALHRDISEGAAWRASSAYDGSGEGRLPHRGLRWSEPNYFFHTNLEPEPWLVIDLGRERTVREVVVVNRLDCCYERAARIRLELASDDGVYSTVLSRFAPVRVPRRRVLAVEPRRARYVRLSTPGEGPLHFADVRVLGD